jgi:hypothetical protein
MKFEKFAEIIIYGISFPLIHFKVNCLRYSHYDMAVALTLRNCGVSHRIYLRVSYDLQNNYRLFPT